MYLEALEDEFAANSWPKTAEKTELLQKLRLVKPFYFYHSFWMTLYFDPKKYWTEYVDALNDLHCCTFVFPDLYLDKQTKSQSNDLFLHNMFATIRSWSSAAPNWTEFTFKSQDVKVKFVSQLGID